MHATSLRAAMNLGSIIARSTVALSPDEQVHRPFEAACLTQAGFDPESMRLRLTAWVGAGGRVAEDRSLDGGRRTASCAISERTDFHH